MPAASSRMARRSAGLALMMAETRFWLTRAGERAPGWLSAQGVRGWRLRASARRRARSAAPRSNPACRRPSPRRARIVLAEKGIAHEVRQVDLASAEQLSEEYRKINPACTVPALVLAGIALLPHLWS